MKKYNVLLIAFLFMLLYYPPLLKINMLHIIGVMSWIYIILKRKSISRNLNIKKIKRIYLLFTFLTIYIFIIVFVYDNEYELTARFLYWMVDIIPGCIVTLNECFRRKYQEEELVTLLLIVGTLQGVLAVLAFINPEFQAFFINQMLSNGWGEAYLNLAKFRMYGVSSNLTFTTPILQSVLAIIAIFLAIKKDMKYIFFFPLLAFSAVINARIALIVIVIGTVAIFLSSRKLDFRRISKALIFLSVGILILRALLYLVEFNSQETFVWLESGMNEIISFLNGDTTGYFSYVTDQNRYTLPTGLAFLFGKGASVLGSYKYGFASDIGWINDIWMGGIVYSLIIYIFYGRIIWQINYGDNRTELRKFLALFFLLIFFAINFKGLLISSNEVMTVIFLVLLFITSRYALRSQQ